MKNEDDGQKISEMKDNFVKAVAEVLGVPKVNIDCENKLGFTPLFFAVTNGSEEVARLLVQGGACVTTETDDGDTIEEVIQQKMPNIVEDIDSINKENKDTIENKLFQLLYFESYVPGKFVEEWEKAESNNNRVMVDANNGNYTFLQFCCDTGDRS